MTHTVLIKDGDNEFNFEVERIKPSSQFNLLLKVIGLAAKGSLVAPKQVEALLHNALKTGVQVDTTGEVKYDGEVSTMFVDAIKGAIATLEDKDRDYLINALLERVTLVNAAGRFKATTEELDKRFSSFVPLFTLLREVATINFRQSLPEKK